MNPSGNTILITGGGSGIGRGLAEALHAAGNRVIIAGRRRDALDEVVTANPGMSAAVLDVADGSAAAAFAAQLVRDYPALNVLINNAGIMRPEDLTAEPVGLGDAEATIATNLLGPIRLTAALLPHLKRQPAASVINVSSGLAFVPIADTPTYCATKAAIHSYSQSLRHQLRETSVQVIEIIPPWVDTGLMPSEGPNPAIVPLGEFITETMALLRADPAAEEICVERVKLLRKAEAEGRYGRVFGMINGH